MKKTMLIFSLFILLVSCSDFTSGTRFEQTKFTLTGLLFEGKPVSPEYPISIGKTIEANGGNIEDLFVLDAGVLLINKTTNDTVQLTFYASIPDTESHFTFGFIDPNWETDPFPILAENTYRVEATIPTDESSQLITAETTVPSIITLNPLGNIGFTSNPEPPYPEISYENANIDHPLQVSLDHDAPVNLFFQFYCLEEYDNAYFILDLPGDQEKPENEEEYEDPVNGYPRKIKWWYSYQAEWDEQAQTNIISDRGYKVNFFFYGNYEIQVYAIDDNYYSYLYKTNGFMHGGVQNGYGYFGSCSGGTIYTKVIE